MIRLALLVSILTGCNIRGGFAVDPFYDKIDESSLYGIVEVSYDIDSKVDLYYRHTSDPTTKEDGYGQNMFGFNYKFFGSNQCHK